jgi:hypothetical protein
VVSGTREERFRQTLRDIGSGLPLALMECADERSLGLVAPDDYPVAGLLKLQNWLNLQLQAICWLLMEPLFEAVAFGMSRGLLEGWAHYWWVRGREPQGRLCRSMRLDQMFAKEEFDATRRSNDSDALSVRQRRVDLLQSLSQRFGCLGPPRKLKGVAGSLRDIEQTAGLDWPLLMWHQTSLVAHQIGFSWLVVAADGKNEFREPTIQDRSVRLYHAFVIFRNCGELFLELTDAVGSIPRFREVCDGFEGGEFLQFAQLPPEDRA